MCIIYYRYNRKNNFTLSKNIVYEYYYEVYGLKKEKDMR